MFNIFYILFLSIIFILITYVVIILLTLKKTIPNNEMFLHDESELNNTTSEIYDNSTIDKFSNSDIIPFETMNNNELIHVPCPKNICNCNCDCPSSLDTKCKELYMFNAKKIINLKRNGNKLTFILVEPINNIIFKKRPCRISIPMSKNFIPSLWSKNGKKESDNNFVDNPPNVTISNGIISSIITFTDLKELKDGSYQIKAELINEDVYDLTDNETNLTITIDDGYVTKLATIILKKMKNMLHKNLDKIISDVKKNCKNTLGKNTCKIIKSPVNRIIKEISKTLLDDTIDKSGPGVLVAMTAFSSVCPKIFAHLNDKSCEEAINEVENLLENKLFNLLDLAIHHING